MTDNSAMFHQLRDAALAMRADQLAPSETEPAIGAVMDLSVGDGKFACVVGFLTGEASIYLSPGGGSIGGGAHESVQKAAKAFVTAAVQALPLLRPATATPLPSSGMTDFYVITPRGLFTASENEDVLGNGRSNLSPLFYAGQNIIAAYREWEAARRAEEK
ncbi:MAG TPA: hypothetical protein VNU97_19405 [Rhizomicrobium sp.]|jgi:hypothetical protein|nr:hypothetical protein [Rhizomicrobium sp.]